MEFPQQIGRYEIRRQVGRGGMAVVLEAWDPVLHRTLAVKLVDKTRLDPSIAQDALRRFRREAQAAARLTHPNIVQVYEYGEEEEFAWIAMEYVAGKALTAYLVEGLRTEVLRVRDIVGQLLEALAYSHNQGVVHRDIKPGNLLVTPEGQIKVTDFGIARIEASVLTQRGDMLGTPSYMSPEQYMGEATDGRSDIFAAGVILYELLTGERPFRGDSSGQIMQKILHDTPANVSELNPLVPPAVDWLIGKALAKDAQDRFASAREFQSALYDAVPDVAHDASAGSEPVRAQPGFLNTARKLRGLSKGAGETIGPGTGAAPVFAPDTQQQAKTRILFVDDEERILTALKTIFRSRYHVLTAANGQEALEFIRKFRIPVIVSDQRMPGMTGVELLRKSVEASPDSVRILLTGYSDLASIVGSINDGEVYRFISKPWDNQELQSVIAEAVGIGNKLLERQRQQLAPPAKLDGAVLVLDERREVFEALNGMAGGSLKLIHARNIQEALMLLESSEVAILVADIDMEAENYLVFFNLLKSKYPQILVLVQTSASDSELVIHLINEAQIYRFLNKPVNLSLMQQYLHSAIGRYAEYRNAPELLDRHRVKQSKAAEGSFGRSIVERLKSLKLPFAPARS
jgi:response regulator RpfG family c-di-GMP phosphodiesterase/tRNA A-37 threonylcarbamoyl transferase component Bud32